MSEPMALPTQPPAPIDPKRPVRGLGEWLSYLGFMVMAYMAARNRVSAIVLYEAETAPVAELFGPGGDEGYDPTHPVTKWVAGKLRAYSDAKVRAKVAEDGIMPKLANIAEGISRCTAIVTPFVDGIHKHLGALGDDTAAWETRLALMLRKLNVLIGVDRFFLEHETFNEPDYFTQKAKAVDDDLLAFLTELGAKVDNLATVALPTDEPASDARPGGKAGRAKAAQTAGGQVAEGGEREKAAQAADANRKPAASDTEEEDAGGELRHWTQGDLDAAIEKYKAERAVEYSRFISILNDRNAATKARRKAMQAATRMFGRNAIAKALEVRSRSMVSKAPAWTQIAEALGLRLHRGQATGTKYTTHTGKVGLGVAVDEKSEATSGEGDNAAPHAARALQEREVTLGKIRRFAESAAEFKGKKAAADRKRCAEALLKAYESGEMTDEQVRKTIELKLTPPDV